MPLSTTEHTSRTVSTKAATALRDPAASPRERSLAGSALTQAPDRTAVNPKREEQQLRIRQMRKLLNRLGSLLHEVEANT